MSTRLAYLSVEVTSIGLRIRQLRDRAGMSQRQLAKKLSITQPAVVAWEMERCQPRIKKLPAIAKALGVSVEELMFGKRAA